MSVRTTIVRASAFLVACMSMFTVFQVGQAVPPCDPNGSQYAAKGKCPDKTVGQCSPPFTFNVAAVTSTYHCGNRIPPTYQSIAEQSIITDVMENYFACKTATNPAASPALGSNCIPGITVLPGLQVIPTKDTCYKDGVCTLVQDPAPFGGQPNRSCEVLIKKPHLSQIYISTVCVVDNILPANPE
jgi:hypothetical protein